ncbi:DUF6512 family protein [Oscillospiraceae bacterium WX1]
MRRTTSKKDPVIAWMLLGIPILFIAASPLHFVFEWTGGNVFTGLFAPVNESVWEHLKLTFWPLLVWWIIGYLLFHKAGNWSFKSFVVTGALAEFTCALFIVAFFYTYTGALGIESLILDIISLLLGLVVGILTAVHIYRFKRPGSIAALIATLALFVMAAAFLYFTFYPPHLPIFMDPPTGTYGIGH